MFRLIGLCARLRASRNLMRLMVPAAALVVVLSTAGAAQAKPHPSINSIAHGLKFACGVPRADHARCLADVVTQAHSVRPLSYAAPPSTAINPTQMAHAYKFDQLGCALTGTANLCGANKTIAIVDAYDAPHIAQDLNTFDSAYGLPACTTGNGCFQEAFSGGTQPAYDSGWAQEISLDVQWAHAMAPGAKILLVEAPSASDADLLNAVDYAVSHGANVVSMSWGGSEPGGATQTSDDTHFSNPNVTFVAASGDSGYSSDWPVSSPDVTAVGGTTLNVDTAGNRSSETTWSCSSSLYCSWFGGTGGGTSAYEAMPSYQLNYTNPASSPAQTIGAVAGDSTHRSYSDVAYNADPNTGVAICDTDLGSSGCWEQIGGTSAGAPQWASIIAITKSRNGSAQIRNDQLYGAGNTSSSYSGNFYDITSGENGSCSACYAKAGWDVPTGLGSPSVAALVSTLAGGAPVTGSPPPPSPSPPSAPTNLTATGGNGQVSLSWTGSSGATSYNIKRSTTSGGPYTTIQNGVGQTTYIDTTARNGTTYYYVVSAVASGVESANSNQASATPTAPPSSNAIANGGFETGRLSPWTTSGVWVGLVNSGSPTCYAGSWCAQGGKNTPTNGDSSLAQTFTAPAGSPSLSFYYKVVCPDTVRYDWATATLKDNTTGTSSTVLGKTCTNSGAWVNVTKTGLTGGDKYTLTLTSHDDNYPGDPTYTLYDNVSVQ